MRTLVVITSILGENMTFNVSFVNKHSMLCKPILGSNMSSRLLSRWRIPYSRQEKYMVGIIVSSSLIYVVYIK